MNAPDVASRLAVSGATRAATGSATCAMADLPTGASALVLALDEAAAPALSAQLQDLGFVPGETVRLLRRAAIGGDPLLLRVGLSTFALRRAEAACVRVLRLQGGAEGRP